MSTPITDIATADAELTRLVDLLRLQEKMLIREVGVIREWLDTEDTPLSEIVTASPLQEERGYEHAANYINQNWEHRTPKTWHHVAPHTFSDRNLALWNAMDPGGYAKRVSISSTGHPLGARMARFMLMFSNMTQTRSTWTEVGQKYGLLLRDEPKAADGLYLSATTSRRETLGWAVTTARTKSSFAILDDPLSSAGAFHGRNFWNATFSVANLATHIKYPFLSTTWEYVNGTHRNIVTVDPNPEWNSERYNLGVTHLTVLLPRAHAAARRAEVENVWGHLSTMFADYKTEVDAINGAKEDTELADLAKEIQENLDKLTEPSKWRDVRLNGHGPQKAFIETVAALPNIDDIIDEVRTKVWTERHGSVPTEAEITAATAIDRSPVEDGDYLPKKWTEYLTTHSVPEFTY